MAGKQTLEIELHPDQASFIRFMMDDYKIKEEGKVFRIMIDYLQSNKDVHDTVFGQTRCLRCD